ncbi:ionotropic receptor 93a [Drosophila pseudoobscura]|uniref:Ionotropic receptor 93a n=1 Tax=Drosophila pseudoobscura pseudoobscura TaxID=46245 RepID=A0A6I8V5X9_DROPS|nr:ionotropic receptor 93a [Drosophila pseudoobscura]
MGLKEKGEIEHDMYGMRVVVELQSKVQKEVTSLARLSSGSQLPFRYPGGMRSSGCLLLLFGFQLYFLSWPMAVEGNDFSSFLSANASLAVVVDHEYMTRHGQNIMAHFEKILSDIIRENLKNGGINVRYFRWNAVRLKKDFLAAITVTDCANTWNFYRSTQETSVLLIAITDSDCPRLPLNKALMAPMVEHGDELPQIILDAKVQQILNWKTAVVLVDQNILDNNSELVKAIVHESTTNHIAPISLILYKIDDSLRGQKKRAALRHALSHFSPINHEQKNQQFLVLSKFHDDIIEIGETMNMFHVGNQWMFFVFDTMRQDFDASTVTINLAEGANIAFALNETNTDCMDTLNCTISEISMALVTAISKMTVEEQSIYGEISDEEWESIRFTKQEKQYEILKYMKEYLKTNSKCASCAKWRFETAITWGKSQQNRQFRTAPTRDARNQNFEFVDIGYWSPLLGFVCQELTFPHIAQHFRNITMDIVTMHNPPWQILTKNSDGVIVEHKGITLEILKELSRALNFSYYLHEAKTYDDEFPLNQSTNESDELLGSMTYGIPYRVVEMVQGNRFFMAAVAATVEDPDKKAFNYTQPVSVQKYSFITRQPDEVSRIYLFTAPFTTETWGCLVGIIFLTAPMLYAINRLAPLQELQIHGLSSVKSCFWYIFGALLQQGGMYLPRADSGRLVVGFWWIVVIVLVTTYCGNLVAFLTFPKFQPGVDYLNQLHRHTEISQYGLRNGTFFEKYVQRTTRDDFKQYVAKAIIYNNGQGEDIEAVKDGQRINIDWRINLQLVVQQHFERDKECRFALGKESFVDEQIALIVPSESAYLHLINQHIDRMFRMGFIERWHRTNLPSADKCNGKSILRQITNHKVNMDDMQGCFLVLLLGFILAVFVGCIEYWFYRLYVQSDSRKPTVFTN